jgi:hypothetical protein
MLGDVAVDPGGQLDHRAEAASRAGQSHNPTQGLVARGRLDGLAGGVPQQPLDPGLEKRRYQRPDRWRTEPGARAACFWARGCDRPRVRSSAETYAHTF